MSSSEDPTRDSASDDAPLETAAPDAPLPVEHAADESTHPAEAAAPPGETPPPPAEPITPPDETQTADIAVADSLEPPAESGVATTPVAAAPPADPVPAAPRRSRLRRLGSFLLRSLAWFLLGLALIAAGVFAYLWLDLKTEADDRAELERHAERFVLALTNFSSATIEEDVDEIKSFAVGDFAKEADVFFGPEAVAAIKEAEAESTGQIESIYVQDLDEDTASVFAVVNETVTNVDLAEPRTDVIRMNVELVESESGWRVTSVEVLQSPGSTPLLDA